MRLATHPQLSLGHLLLLGFLPAPTVSNPPTSKTLAPFSPTGVSNQMAPDRWHAAGNTSPLTNEPQNTLRCVVFSGAASPVDAVEARGTGAAIAGGIVAVGGGETQTPVANPVWFFPDDDYATARLTPPLSPSIFTLSFQSRAIRTPAKQPDRSSAKPR